MYNPKEITQIAEKMGAEKAQKNQRYSFLSAITAGAFIAIAFVFYTTTQTGGQDVAWGLIKLVGGLAFSLGIIMVVVCGSELFTSSTMTIIARATHKITTWQMLRNWIVVYIGNFIGGLIIVALVWFAGMTLKAEGQWGEVILTTAQSKVNHSWLEAFCLGIFCNIMVCIGIWMSYAGKTLVDKAFILILPIAMFVASGFEHVVANMFMLPMGIITTNFSSMGFWQNLGIESSDFADLTMKAMVIKNLIPVTLGNIVGGAFCIAFIQWLLNKNQA